jgi:hypothetical protein
MQVVQSEQLPSSCNMKAIASCSENWFWFWVYFDWATCMGTGSFPGGGGKAAVAWC